LLTCQEPQAGLNEVTIDDRACKAIQLLLHRLSGHPFHWRIPWDWTWQCGRPHRRCLCFNRGNLRFWSGGPRTSKRLEGRWWERTCYRL
jgi:hypothetical protein